MSSEAAQKAYPSKADESIADRVRKAVQCEAFDKGAQHGAVEALRQAAAVCERIQNDPEFRERGAGVAAAKLVINAMADEWEAGR